MQPSDPFNKVPLPSSEGGDGNLATSPTHNPGQVIQPKNEHMTGPGLQQDQTASTGVPSLPKIDSSDPGMAPQTIMPGQPPSFAVNDEPKKRFKFKSAKTLVMVLAALLILGGGGAAAYFGYIIPNKPENLWSTALTNTSKGYDKLSKYATSDKNIKGMSADGSFKLSGGVAADSSFKGASDGKNGNLTGSVSAAGLKVNYDVRAIESPGNTPDIYFKLDGVQGLGDMVSGFVGGETNTDNAGIVKALNGLNGQWYFVDHTLFDQFTQGSNSDLQFTSKDVDEILKAIGDSSKKYLFTSDSKNAAIVVKQNVGKETQDGRSVYHYKVGINKTNLTAYSKSLCENLTKTKLFKTFGSGSSGDTDLIKECQDSTGLENIKESQTADAWVDSHTKLIHKIRISEEKNKNNYIDIAQNYTGGDEFPFSIGFHSKESIDSGFEMLQNSGQSAGSSSDQTQTGLISMKLNMKTNTFSIDAKFESTGSSNDKATFKLNIAPSNEQIKVEKPANSKTIIQLLNDIGIGDITGDVQGRAKDTERRTDINADASQLEVYYTDNGGYPVFTGQVNSDSWISANLKGADLNAWRAPNQKSNSMVNSATPTIDQYGYVPLKEDGVTACTQAPCARYKLYWHSESSNTVNTKESLN